MKREHLKPGDEIDFGGKRYVLIERRFPEGLPMWFVAEKHGDKLRLLLEKEVLACPEADFGGDVSR